MVLLLHGIAISTNSRGLSESHRAMHGILAYEASITAWRSLLGSVAISNLGSWNLEWGKFFWENSGEILLCILICEGTGGPSGGRCWNSSSILREFNYSSLAVRTSSNDLFGKKMNSVTEKKHTTTSALFSTVTMTRAAILIFSQVSWRLMICVPSLVLWETYFFIWKSIFFVPIWH